MIALISAQIVEFNTWIGDLGVWGAILAAIAALFCFVGAWLLLGALVRRVIAARRPPDPNQPVGPDARANAVTVFRIAGLVILTLLVIGAGLLLLADALTGLKDDLRWIAATAFAVLMGGGVGAAELVSRYKDRPDKAVCTTPAIFYISLNALASAGALYLIYIYGDAMKLSVSGAWAADAIVKAVLIAGFSSLLFFRTNLFKLRVGDTDLAVGPSIILDSLLAAADRAVDRVMAEPRAEFVHKVMKDVSFEKAAVILPTHCLALMQNVSSSESQRIAGVVNQLRADKEMPDKIKSLNLGLAVLTVVGERVLETAVHFLEGDIQDTTTRLVQDVAEVMRPVSFERAQRMLPRYCLALWPKAVPQDAEDKVKTDTASLALLSDVPEEYKAILLGIWLARLTDGATLRKAVTDLGASIGRDKTVSSRSTQSTPTQPAAIQPSTGVPPTGTQPTGTPSTEIKPTEIKPTEIKPTEIKPTEIKPADAKRVPPEATESKPTEAAKPDGAGPPNKARPDVAAKAEAGDPPPLAPPKPDDKPRAAG